MNKIIDYLFDEDDEEIQEKWTTFTILYVIAFIFIILYWL